MYNRYIGNTGKVIRVEEPERKEDRGEKPQAHQSPENRRQAENAPRHEEQPAHRRGESKSASLLSGFGGGLADSIDSILPFGLETGDLVLLVLFLFLFIESGDEEFLIILGFLAYSFFKDSREK